MGPPGTGKTTTLARQVAHDVARYGSGGVLVASLTRAAAAEIAGRDLPLERGQVGTLHAHCYRALSHPSLTEGHLKQWNDYCPEFALTDGGRGNADDPDWDRNDGPERALSGDEALARLDLERAQMTPPDEWPQDAIDFHARWQAWKRETGYLDFTDLIEVALSDVAEAPGSPAVLIADETQDYSALEMTLCRRWARRCERFYAAGDPDQCQPGDAQVLTTGGYRAIADLNPATDHIVSYDRHSQEVVGLRDGYAFSVASRLYRGSLLRLTTAEGTTRCTPNHRWLVRWQTRAVRYNAVYLMRRGDWWRVGWCQVFNSEGTFHVGMRARLERADAIWILRLFDNKTDASAYESYVAARYGLPLLPFQPVAQAQYITTETIGRVFGDLDAHCRMTRRALRCLSDHGRDRAYPIWQRVPAYEKRGLTRVSVVAAANLFPEIMLIPSHQGGKRAAWTPFSLTREPHDGPVYSLDVDKHHLYIADGLVTHNSIYSWRGADPNVFRTPALPPEQTKILAQSFRVPRAVHEKAAAWIDRIVDREPVTYRPRDADGLVRRLPAATWQRPAALVRDVAEQVDQGREVMILSSCSYLLAPTIRLLRQEGIAYHNPYRLKRGDWNPLRTAGTSRGSTSTLDRLLSYLRPSITAWGDQARMWNPEDLRRWTALVRTEGVLRKGGRERIAQQLGTDELGWETLAELFEAAALDPLFDLDLDWLERSALAARAKALQFPLAIARERGVAALREPPRVVVGTIHSTKGGESPVVYVLPDVSQAGYTEWLSPGERRDAVVRLFYVAVTRAREELVICGAGGRNAVPL